MKKMQYSNKQYNFKKNLLKTIENKEARTKDLLPIYTSLIQHLESSPCATISNYTGVYGRAIINACIQHYPEVFDQEIIENYTINNVREVMERVFDQLISIDFVKIKSEYFKILMDYISKKDATEEIDKSVKIIYEMPDGIKIKAQEKES